MQGAVGATGPVSYHNPDPNGPYVWSGGGRVAKDEPRDDTWKPLAEAARSIVEHAEAGRIKPMEMCETDRWWKEQGAKLNGIGVSETCSLCKGMSNSCRFEKMANKPLNCELRQLAVARVEAAQGGHLFENGKKIDVKSFNDTVDPDDIRIAKLGDAEYQLGSATLTASLMEDLCRFGARCSNQISEEQCKWLARRAIERLGENKLAIGSFE